MEAEMCRLWVNLESAGPRRHKPEPVTYLNFVRTGFLVGLVDEPGIFITEEHPHRLALRVEDADGLGLEPEDFADGVVICRAGADGGWSCEPIEVTIGEPEGEVTNPEYWDAVRAAEAARAEAARIAAAPPVAFEPLFAEGSRVLVLVDDAWQQEGLLQQIAQLGRDANVQFILGAVGELAETSAHAEEERATLLQRLERAREQFDGLVSDTAYDMGGDPVHGILSMAEEQRPDLILLPDSTSTNMGAVAAQLKQRTNLPVRRLRVRSGRVEADAA